MSKITSIKGFDVKKIDIDFLEQIDITTIFGNILV